MSRIYKQYKMKFYLNMNHFIEWNGKKGEIHPHTWEIIISVVSEQEKITLFASLEKKVEQIIEQYQDKLLNECDPFDKLMPTVENAAMYFFRLIQEHIIEDGWVLLMLELSETPTRSYIINAMFEEDNIWNDWYEQMSQKNLERFPDADFS